MTWAVEPVVRARRTPGARSAIWAEVRGSRAGEVSWSSAT